MRTLSGSVNDEDMAAAAAFIAGSGFRQLAAQRTDNAVVAMSVVRRAGAEYGRAGDEGVGTRTSNFGNVVDLHATIVPDAVC